MHSEGIHGYALRHDVERVLGAPWRVKLGEIYRVLEHLAAERLVEPVPTTGYTTQKRYRITPRGVQVFERFLLAPPTDAPVPMRQELMVKLAFVTAQRLPALLRWIAQQREAYVGQLRDIGAQRRKLAQHPDADTFLTRVLLQGAEYHTHAELAWLDEAALRLRERFGRLDG
jgi:DNA-binding PadR family transcriptional regulator